jgi:putative transcriptional regulator
LRDWEQGRSEPDAPAKALLKLIAADPEGAAEKLKPALRPAAE